MKPAKHHILPHIDPAKPDSNPEYFVVYRKTKIKKINRNESKKRELDMVFIIIKSEA